MNSILPIKNARWVSCVGDFVNPAVLFEEVIAVAQDDVGVDVVDAGQQQVVGVDQVVRDGREVCLHSHEQSPAEVKNFA